MLDTALTRLRQLSSSASIRAAVTFAGGGGAFALANLLLARHLTPTDYALIALILALKELGGGLGVAGVDLVVNRHRLAPTGRLAARVLFTGVVAGGITYAVATGLYSVPTQLAVLSLVIVAALSLNGVAAALFQSEALFSASLSMIQIHNFVLLLLVPAGLALGLFNVDFVVATVACAYVLVAAFGWRLAHNRLSAGRVSVPESVLFKEGLGGMGIGLATLAMWQIERLVVPLTLSMNDLATFGVLAAIVSAPFRMLQIGIGYTLLPRLRSATSAYEARRLIRSELKIAVTMAVTGTGLILLLGPLVVDVLTAGKYQLGYGLLAAAIVVGFLRIWQGIAVATVSAVGDASALQWMNAGGWAALLFSAAGAWGMSCFGLQGLIYGAALGWLFQATVATMLARTALVERWQAHAA